MSDEFVTIKSFTTEIEAEIVKGRLLTEGIESFIIKDDCGGMYPQLRLTQGVLLKVRRPDMDLALKLIAPADIATPPATGAAVKGEMAAMLSINAWIIGIIGLGLMLAGLSDGKWFYIGLAVLAVGLGMKFLSRSR